MRVRHIVLGAALIAAVLLAIPITRDAIFLQNEWGSPIPFVLYMLLGLLPSSLALLGRTRPFSGWALVQRIRATALEAHAWAILFVLVALETLADPPLTRWFGHDLTPLVAAFEGDAVARVQDALRNPVLDIIGSAVYSYGYVLVYPGVIGYALLRGDRTLARPLLFAFINVWLVGLPAYLFLPVNEPWFGSDTVENVLHTTVPPSAENPFLAYSINNELPSLHSALAIACATTLWRIGRRAAFALVAFPALSLPFFVVYLGIHWVVDAVTGVLLGFAAAWLATRSEVAGKPEIPPPPSAAPTSHAEPQR